jgi:hypothetical protein
MYYWLYLKFVRVGKLCKYTDIASYNIGRSFSSLVDHKPIKGLVKHSFIHELKKNVLTNDEPR